MSKKSYSVVELARLANVTERTLRYYDEIQLLLPIHRDEHGRRRYGLDELYRLQQILLYREMGFDLESISEILDNPSFDLIQSLRSQRGLLANQQKRMEQLIALIDKTIYNMQDKSQPLKVEDLYEGLSKETIDEYRNEAEDRWGDEFRTSEAKLRQSSRKEIRDMKQEGHELVQKLAGLMRLNPDDAVVQKTIAQYHEHLNRWNETPKERWSVLADMYVEDDRFKAHYEQYAAGLASWLRNAIKVYCGE